MVRSAKWRHLIMSNGWDNDLERADGPACPRCHCRDVAIRNWPEVSGWMAQGRAQCRHCGLRFNFRARQAAPSQWQSVASPDDVPPAVSAQTPMIDFSTAKVDHQQQPLGDPAEPTPEQLIQEAGAVVFVPVRCPECSSTSTKITRTLPAGKDGQTTRYHTCRECSHRFKSIQPPGG